MITEPPAGRANDATGVAVLEMQCSTVYNALRGEGMRVRPLAGGIRRRIVTDPAKWTLPKHMIVESVFKALQEVDRAERPVLSNIFDMLKSKSSTAPTDKHRLTSKKDHPETPCSNKSNRQVPYTSTVLEKQLSRASLKEEDSQTVGKSWPSKPAKKRRSFHFKQRIKSYNYKRVAGVSSNLPQAATLKKGHRRTLSKHPMRKHAEGQGSRKAAATSSARKVRRELEREEIPTVKRMKKKTGTTVEMKKSVQSSETVKKKRVLNSGGPSSHRSSRNRLNSVPETASAAGLSAIAIMAKSRSGLTKSVGPFSSAANSSYRPPRKTKVVAHKRSFGDRNNRKKRTLAASTESSATSDSDSATTVTTTSVRGMNDKRKEMEQKSVEFFNLFKYGNVLSQSLPKFRYKSDAGSDGSQLSRLSDIELMMRLNRLEESALRISQLIPRWSAMLLVTKEPNRAEQIKKTLTNAQVIVDGKLTKAKAMLQNYRLLSETTNRIAPTTQMEEIRNHSELVQLDMDSLERLFEVQEKLLRDEQEDLCP